jgi:prephenate dehydratase
MKTLARRCTRIRSCSGVAAERTASEMLDTTASGAQGAFRAPAAMESTKTSLVFSIADEPGALMKALGTFHTLKVNITRLESKPNVRNPREMDMIVDVEGDGESGRGSVVSTAVKELRALGFVVDFLAQCD